MFVEMIRDKELDGRTKMIMESLAQVYEDNLPETLSMNHYELADQFGFTAQQWNNFLRDDAVNHLIESEIASISEIGARKALDRLQKGSASSPDIQAAKEILSTSRIIKQKTNQRPQVVITRIPDKEGLDDDNG